MDADIPNVSFVIASFNSGEFLIDCVKSALAQSGVTVEVIVIDDHSMDGSLAIALRLAEKDSRVRVYQTPSNGGPARARNVGIAQARGTWIAVLDSDDLIHSSRSSRLITEAEVCAADIVADDLLLFDDDRIAEPSLFLDVRRAARASWIDLPSYFDETRMYGRRPNLGFLKPMIRASALRRCAVRYDESLRIAEDDALIIDLMRAGLRYRLLPEPLYFYRKHGGSISHRLSAANADKMLAAGERLRADMSKGQAPLPALERRHRALRGAWAFSHFIDALKARDLPSALRILVREPAMVPLLRMPLGGALRKLSGRIRPQPAPPPLAPNAVLFISRQRLMGATNGSSAYLLALARAVRAAGLVPHLLQPSVRIFGRTPFFRLGPEMGVFESIHVRKGLAAGSWLIAMDWPVFAGGGWAIVSRKLRSLGLTSPLLRDRKLESSVSLPWSREELRLVASHARFAPGAVIADYMFQNHALPYVLNPDARTATVMHDLFHMRVGQFHDGKDSVATITLAEELAMLGAADAVIAIQSAEAAFVAQHLPASEVLLAQMPMERQARSQPGDASRLLFVGSDTAPNSLGLRWFFDAVWPKVRAGRADITLDVVGTVARGFMDAVEGVRFVGLVPDLAEWYANAGIVISPLRQGSGLKIKLIEALAHGKACVVTRTTLQGMDTTLDEAVVCTDEADAFAEAILRLAADDQARGELAEKASEAARQFEPDSCMAAFSGWLQRPG